MASLELLVMPEQEYPTDEELTRIEDWPLGDGRGLFAFVEEVWSHHYGRMWRSPRRIRFATGGWSGNEDIIRALDGNISGMSNWVLSKRGGYHEYAYPPRRLQSRKHEQSGCIRPYYCRPDVEEEA